MYAKLANVRLLSGTDSNRPTYLFALDTGDFSSFNVVLQITIVDYLVGDVVGIHPENINKDVLLFLEWYGLNATAVISIFAIDDATPLPIPSAVTVLHLFSRYLDIFAVPRKLFFRQLAHFATNPSEKSKLEIFSSKDGSEQLSAYLKDKPSYVDVLRDFPSAHPTTDFLVEMIPMIKPRLYSVASSMQVELSTFSGI